ncbi:hypothetical protein EXE59_06550 [Nocardioides eburneiflavus]|uniref:Uncharacterized protein n=1 Tax=Nocardioides eburneiflavus TaxID=2518372 RepID=A0A4Z1CEC0_9ACTN|nr:hypothetical protein [Nocardioides eburneiflavus]TGN63648.1 hypothetical protein EXE59_06550 [Nocardioides eburneiflavus]
MFVALFFTVATLSACSSMTDGGTTITADELAQQEEEPHGAGAKHQQQRQRKKKTSARSTATNADLDAYVASAEKALREMFGGTFRKIYSEIDIVPVYPNGIAYDYTFRAAVDPALARPQLDRQAPTLRTQARTVVVPEMERMGFASPTVTYTYRNPDGSVVWTRRFS